MRCQICGHENPERALYCEQCGAIIAGQARPDDYRLSGPKDDIRKAIESRTITDRIMPAWIVWVNIALSIASVIGIFAYVFSAFANADMDFEEAMSQLFSVYAIVFVVSMVSQLIFAVIAFFLVDRNNNHSARESRLKKAVFALARSAATTRESQQAISRELQALEYHSYSGAKRRSPALWALLVAFPSIGAGITIALLGVALRDLSIGALFGAISLGALFSFIGYISLIYMFYFLMKEQSAHEARWIGFAMGTRSLLTRLGFPPGRGYRLTRSPDRSFALYLVLTIFIGIFIYYWWYVMIKDPNEHYRNQWLAEDSLLDAIGR